MNRSLPIPREHGAYIVLGSAWALGNLNAAPRSWWQPVVSLLLALSAFALPELIRAYERNKKKARKANSQERVAFLAIGSLFSISSAVAVASAPAILLLTLPAAAMLALTIRARRRKAPLAVQSFVGFAALSLVAPLAAMLNGMTAWAPLAACWFLSAAFFCGSNVNVAVRLGDASTVRRAATYHFAIIPMWCALAFGFSGFLAGLLSLVANLLRFVWITRNTTLFRHTTLKRIGLQEAVLSVLFLSLNALQLF